MNRHTRRDFLKSAAAAGLATSFTIAGTKASARVLGPTTVSGLACVA